MVDLSCITVFLIINSGLITTGDNAGSLLEINQTEFESGFYSSCCIDSEDYCSEYQRTRRPINDGSNYVPPSTSNKLIYMYSILKCYKNLDFQVVDLEIPTI